MYMHVGSISRTSFDVPYALHSLFKYCIDTLWFKMLYIIVFHEQNHRNIPIARVNISSSKKPSLSVLPRLNFVI